MIWTILDHHGPLNIPTYMAWIGELHTSDICGRPRTDIHTHVHGHFWHQSSMHIDWHVPMNLHLIMLKAYFKLVVLSAVPLSAIPSTSWLCLLALIGPYRLIDHQLRESPWTLASARNMPRSWKITKRTWGAPQTKLTSLMSFVGLCHESSSCGDEDSEWSSLMAEQERYIDTYCNLIRFILLNIFNHPNV